MKITTDVLKRLGACADQVKLFDKLFPGGTTVTLRRLARARKHDLNVYWFTHRVLSAAAWDTYNKRTLAAYRHYQTVCNMAWNAYEKTPGIRDAEGINPRSIAWAKFCKIRDAAFAVYNHARDIVLVAMLKKPANLKPGLGEKEA